MSLVSESSSLKYLSSASRDSCSSASYSALLSTSLNTNRIDVDQSRCFCQSIVLDYWLTIVNYTCSALPTIRTRVHSTAVNSVLLFNMVMLTRNGSTRTKPLRTKTTPARTRT